MSKVSSNQKETVERKTDVQFQKPGCPVHLNGCIWLFAGVLMVGILLNEYKRSKIRLEMDTIKLENMKSSNAKDGTNTIAPDTLKYDTLKIWGYQKSYVPLLKQYKSEKGR